jgi:hypothetical protein
MIILETFELLTCDSHSQEMSSIPYVFVPLCLMSSHRKISVNSALLRHANIFFGLYAFDSEIWRAKIGRLHTYIYIHIYVLHGYINISVWLLCCHGYILYIWYIVNKIIPTLCYLHIQPDCFIHKYVLFLKMLLLRKLLF